MWFLRYESSVDDRVEYRHTDETTVSRLSEIGGARVGVYFRVDFIHPWQGVHHDAVPWHTRERFRVHDVDAARALVVFASIAEALFLNTRLIDDIGEGEDALEIFGFFEVDAPLLEIGEDVSSHLDWFGRDQEDFFDGVVFGEEVGEGSDGSSIEEVAHESYSRAIDRAQLVFNREEIEERLGRVLSRAITRIDDGDGTYVRCAIRRARFVVPQDDCVRIVLDDANGVFECLALHC